jgi:hypothetical protein
MVKAKNPEHQPLFDSLVDNVRRRIEPLDGPVASGARTAAATYFGATNGMIYGMLFGLAGHLAWTTVRDFAFPSQKPEEKATWLKLAFHPVTLCTAAGAVVLGSLNYLATRNYQDILETQVIKTLDHYRISDPDSPQIEMIFNDSRNKGIPLANYEHNRFWSLFNIGIMALEPALLTNKKGLAFAGAVLATPVASFALDYNLPAKTRRYMKDFAREFLKEMKERGPEIRAILEIQESPPQQPTNHPAVSGDYSQRVLTNRQQKTVQADAGSFAMAAR